MCSIEHALIMAAGRGMRLMPLTAVIPKPLAPYLDTTLIGDGIRKLKPYVPNIHVTAGYKGAVLAQHVIDLGVNSVFNTSGHGNSWWLFNTLLKHLDAPLLVLTCDNIVELDFEFLCRQYRSCGDPACLLVPVKPVPGLEGDYIFTEGRRVVRLDRHQPGDVYCSGIQILNPYVVNRIVSPADNFYDVWSQLISREGLVASETYPKQWYAVDTLDQLNAANAEQLSKTHSS